MSNLSPWPCPSCKKYELCKLKYKDNTPMCIDYEADRKGYGDKVLKQTRNSPKELRSYIIQLEIVAESKDLLKKENKKLKDIIEKLKKS